MTIDEKMYNKYICYLVLQGVQIYWNWMGNIDTLYRYTDTVAMLDVQGVYILYTHCTSTIATVYMDNKHDPYTW